jgi:hypothetical protein
MALRGYARITYSKALLLMILAVALIFSILPTACSTSASTNSEILIALKPEAIDYLRQLQEPEPMHTGIPSLDSLNRKWDVLQMVRVFPDISPDDKIAARYGLAGIYKLVVPEGTDLAAMIRDYQADPHVDYAELNQPFEAK